MRVIGVTGQFCSGKSTVARMLAKQLNAAVVDADRIGHRVLEDSNVRRKLISRFGNGITASSGAIDRKALAVKAFASRQNHRMLCRTTHPLLAAAIINKLKQIKLKEPDGIAVVDAAVLIEMGLLSHIDKLIAVKIDPKEQMERAQGKWGLPERQISKRIKLQISQSRLIKKADFIIDNSGGLEETRRQVEKARAKIWRTGD